MKDASPKAIYLKDYQQPNYWIENTELSFDLHDDYTEVVARYDLVRNASVPQSDSQVLHGQELELISVSVNDVKLDDASYVVDDESLTLKNLDSNNRIEIVTRIYPHKNTSLEGLYKSRTMYCTQCEAEGFRKITYYLDRPDVMSTFTTRVEAEADRFPILLSNGNKIESGTLDGGRHFATWQDPFKKPCYLFALVAGDLSCVKDSFTTMSNREIALELYVEEKDLDKCEHAIRSLKNSMKWDEDTYGREYDLDIFMIVAVDDFNMGAMENKGLNIFNTSCVLANPLTTTDAGFQRVEGVVAHEYFHNWSGNRVTCRDWFQLSLKEGFTVFRDQEFSADMNSRTVKRVEDVSMLRTMQFAEDAGPLAHPVQPASFIEISNFYTLTIYEKGSEIVRMIHTLLGEELFRKGSDLYFERHDGEAVTIDDFVAAMADVSGRDFTQFMHWYRQAGTPELNVSGKYDENLETFTLTFKQSCRPTAECKEKQPYHIPVSMGLLGEAGALRLDIEGQEVNTETSDNTQTVIELTKPEESITFKNIKERPVPSLLRGLSAPVKLKYRYSREDLVRLMRQDDDGFNRWDASQQLAISVIEEVMAALANDPAPKVDEGFIEAVRSVLTDESLDPAMVALMLSLPSVSYLAEQQTQVDIDSIYHARERVQRKLAQSLHSEFLAKYNALNTNEAYSVEAAAIAKRSLKNACLHYLMVAGKEEGVALCTAQIKNANNMTDELDALRSLVYSPKASLAETQKQALDDFYEKWKHEALVVNSWLAVQASNPKPDTLASVHSLMNHESYDELNPNKIRSLVGGFAMRNPVNFHGKKGDGYEFLANEVIRLNEVNPQIASRLITPLTKWRRYDEQRQLLMKKQLERIKAQDNLSKDVYEVVTLSLAEE